MAVVGSVSGEAMFANTSSRDDSRNSSVLKLNISKLDDINDVELESAKIAFGLSDDQI